MNGFSTNAIVPCIETFHENIENAVVERGEGNKDGLISRDDVHGGEKNAEVEVFGEHGG